MHFTYDSAGPLSVNYNGTEYFYVRNAQGDVTGIVNTGGTRVVTYSYDAWGNLQSVTGSLADTLGAQNPLRYRGYVYDSETGLYYLNSRYYNPVWRRFINSDSLIDNRNAVSPNLFTYCGNNPINYSDPNGHFAITLAAVTTFLVSLYVTYKFVERTFRVADEVKKHVEKTKPVPYDKKRDQSVYVMRDSASNEVQYVGRTNDPDRRRKEHLRDPQKRNLNELEIVFTGLTKREAMLAEQLLISAYTLENLKNARREIAIGNVANYAQYMGNVVSLFEGAVESEMMSLMEE